MKETTTYTVDWRGQCPSCQHQWDLRRKQVGYPRDRAEVPCPKCGYQVTLELRSEFDRRINDALGPIG